MEIRASRRTTRPYGKILPGAAALLGGTILLAALLAGAGQEKPKTPPPPERSQAQWTMESHDRTNFPLAGKHRTLTCVECHTNKVFEGTPTACEACHWERRQDDRYRLRLGMTCGECHTPQSWKKVDPNKWSHEAATGYKREGVHQFLDCEECHGTQGFKAQPTDCYGCHAADYQSTQDPNHQQAGFPLDCTACHGTSFTGWSGAKFNHTGFALQGRHATASCSQCHKNGVYAGTSTACASCHINDYNGTTDPNHRANGYSLECQTCHGTSATGWEHGPRPHVNPVVARPQS
jgi:hypothetical protein